MIIRDYYGIEYVLTATTLSENKTKTTRGSCHKKSVRLADIRNGASVGTIIPLRNHCIYNDHNRGQRLWTVHISEQRIGCVRFATSTWSVIMKAVRKARAAKKAKKSSKKAKA